MEKIKHIPLFLFGITAAKLLILGADWASAATLLILAAAYLVSDFKVQNSRLKEIEEVIKKQNEVIGALAKELDKTKTSMSGIQLASGMRSSNVGQR